MTAVIERQKVRQAMRLEHIYAQAMQAWEQSKTEKSRKRQRKTQGTSGGPGATVAEIVVENQHGDPRYLEQALKALTDHRKLWGLDAPQKVDVRASRNPYDGMSEEALLEEVARQARLLGVSTPLLDVSIAAGPPTMNGAPETVPRSDLSTPAVKDSTDGEHE
jgi:hypothetical protein